MASPIENMILQELQDRKQKLRVAVSEFPDTHQLMQLLKEVDVALEKIENGTYGICETCKDSIEIDRLIANPLVRNCLTHLSEIEQRTLERDLDLAYEIQFALLPKKDMVLPGWYSAYHYEASGPVSGDYCDIIISRENPNSFFFIVADVSGKGVSASLLMSQLHATFRILIGTGLKLDELLERANLIFCEGSLTTHFATLVCGQANDKGEVLIANAGHCLPLLARGNKVEEISSTGIPLGVACETKFGIERLTLEHGDRLLLYTDGVSETMNGAGEFYGGDRLRKILMSESAVSPAELITASLNDVSLFRGQSKKTDDLTMMVLQRK